MLLMARHLCAIHEAGHVVAHFAACIPLEDRIALRVGYEPGGIGGRTYTAGRGPTCALDATRFVGMLNAGPMATFQAIRISAGDQFAAEIAFRPTTRSLSPEVQAAATSAGMFEDDGAAVPADEVNYSLHDDDMSKIYAAAWPDGGATLRRGLAFAAAVVLDGWTAIEALAAAVNAAGQLSRAEAWAAVAPHWSSVPVFYDPDKWEISR